MSKIDSDAPPEITIESDGTGLFVRFNGIRIAQRGQVGDDRRGRPKMGWLPLVEGYRVTITRDGKLTIDVPGGARC